MLIKEGDAVTCDLPGTGTVVIVTLSGVAAVKMSNGSRVIRLVRELRLAEAPPAQRPTFADRTNWKPRS